MYKCIHVCLNGLDGISLSKCSKDKILVIFDNIHVIVLFSKAPYFTVQFFSFCANTSTFDSDKNPFSQKFSQDQASKKISC